MGGLNYVNVTGMTGQVFIKSDSFIYAFYILYLTRCLRKDVENVYWSCSGFIITKYFVLNRRKKKAPFVS